MSEAGVRRPELKAGFRYGWQGPKHLNHRLLPPQVHVSRKLGWRAPTQGAPRAVFSNHSPLCPPKTRHHTLWVKGTCPTAALQGLFIFASLKRPPLISKLSLPQFLATATALLESMNLTIFGASSRWHYACCCDALPHTPPSSCNPYAAERESPTHCLKEKVVTQKTREQ